MTTNGVKAAQAQPEREEPRRYWEVWEPSRATLPTGFQELARYVAPEALGDVKWGEGPPHPADAVETQGELAMIRHLFDRLSSRPIDFWRDPWLPDPGPAIKQRIRHPWLLVHGGLGTCLDFTTTFAAMCLEASIPPLLALTLPECDHCHGHAFVLLTPGRTANPPQPLATTELAPGFEETAAAGVFKLVDWAPFETALAAGKIVGLDFDRAIGEESPSFATAAARCRKHLSKTQEENTPLWLVDVAWLQSHGGLQPFDPPATRAPIHPYLPGGRAPFDAYESQAEAFAELKQREGTVVLHGPPGTGKSTLARHLAFRTQFGAAWFLNASEPQALINSLSQAELSSRSDDLRVQDQIDREGFAEQARGRLLEANDDWVVVLDNADGDPARLAPWLPRPNPNRPPSTRQLVLITTTNASWGDLYDFPFLELQPVDDDEAQRYLPGGELTEAANGRPLLFDAFSRLAKATGWSGAEIAERGEEAAEGVDPGAATLWGAATKALAKDSTALRAAAFAAHLPPDSQTLPAYKALLPADDATAAVGRLAELGLVNLDEAAGSLRMHRLVSGAVRGYLHRREQTLCDDVVQEAARNAVSYELLDDRGDLADVTHLEEWLQQIDQRSEEPDPRLGEAMHKVAELLELHGHTRRSGTFFRKSDRHLQGNRKLLARSLHGQARTINQHHGKDPIELRRALRWSDEAQRMMEEEEKDHQAWVAAGASLALKGLLQQKLADFPRKGESSFGLLEEALEILEQAYDRLAADFAKDPERAARASLDPELARRRFNLAGINIRLARERPAEAETRLENAQEIYQEVEARRHAIYKRDSHPHIAACVIGLAYVDYFKALLCPATRQKRTQWLRQATAATMRALEMRQQQEGSLDQDEVSKCINFLVKVAVARAT